MQPNIDGLLGRLDGVAGKNPYRTRCPAHGSRTRTLSLRETSDGTILLYCHGGCSAAAVLRAIGLTEADLFPGSGPPKATPRHLTRRSVQEMVRGESERQKELRLTKEPWGLPSVTTADENAARRRVSRVIGKALPEKPYEVWETLYPNCHDPAWEMCWKRAEDEIFGAAKPFDLIAIEDRAAQLLHELAQFQRCNEVAGAA